VFVALADLISITVASAIIPSGIKFVFLSISNVLSLLGFFSLVYSNCLHEEWEKNHDDNPGLPLRSLRASMNGIERNSPNGSTVSTANSVNYVNRKSNYERSYCKWILTGLLTSILMCS
jgi:hypothetical protein